MKKSDFNSIIISFVLAMIGTIYAYFNASTNPLFGLPIIALLIITFLVSFILLFMIFKYLVFGLILSKKEIIPSKYEPDLYDYNIGVNWVVGGKCKPEAFEEIKKQCIAQLRDIIYGEFKEMIFELYQAVWSEDEDKIKSCINVILDEVNGKNESN